jgi:hypothetical protein
MLKLEQISCASGFNHTIGSNDNGGDDGEFHMEMEQSIKKTPTNFKQIWG